MINNPVPFLSQLDNRNNPFGSCNVTSLAMCLKYLYPEKNFGCPKGVQLEDFIYERMLDLHLDRHLPYDLERLYKMYSPSSYFSPEANFHQIRRHLDAGGCCIIHGWFTRSGHIVVIKGYNDEGFYINDPYGSWTHHGYDNSLTGENEFFLNETLADLCCDTQGCWVHFMQK